MDGRIPQSNATATPPRINNQTCQQCTATLKIAEGLFHQSVVAYKTLGNNSTYMLVNLTMTADILLLPKYAASQITDTLMRAVDPRVLQLRRGHRLKNLHTMQCIPRISRVS